MFKEPKLQITDLELLTISTEESSVLTNFRFYLFIYLFCTRMQMYCDSFATSGYYVTFGVLCSLC